ncbi:hypothetical protein ACM55H_08740 [Flavobacterium sp. ZT3R17]|uniref:hypothetical protein n=1 Tax=Flavobacterium cryoconiti TaxID=3398736 RepID=UPI003A8980A6
MNDQLVDNSLWEIATGNPYELKRNFRRDDEERFYRQSISYLIDDLGLIKQPFKNSPVLQLTPFGLEVIGKGGWLKYTQSKKSAKKEAEENRKAKEKAELENLTSTTKVNQWLLRTKYLPHVLSFVSIVVSIGIGFFTIHSDQEKQSLETRIKELELIQTKIEHEKDSISKIATKPISKKVTKPAANRR